LCAIREKRLKARILLRHLSMAQREAKDFSLSPVPCPHDRMILRPRNDLNIWCCKLDKVQLVCRFEIFNTFYYRMLVAVGFRFPAIPIVARLYLEGLEIVMLNKPTSEHLSVFGSVDKRNMTGMNDEVWLTGFDSPEECFLLLRIGFEEQGIINDHVVTLQRVVV